MAMFNVLVTDFKPITVKKRFLEPLVGGKNNFEVIMKTSPDSHIYSLSHLNSVQIRRYRSMGWIILVGDEIPEPNFDYF